MNIPHVWPRCPEAEAFFARQLREFAPQNSFVEQFAARLQCEAGVHIYNLVDHWLLPASGELANELRACGLVETTIEGEPIWEHPQARFPRVRLSTEQKQPRLALLVERVDQFLISQGLLTHPVQGDLYGIYRESFLPQPFGELAVVERRGYSGFQLQQVNDANKISLAFKTMRERERTGTEESVLAQTQRLLETSVADIGHAITTDLFFEAERRFYMNRNAAARWQYEQQQELGIGWANHDHHTYRSSRESFRPLMQLFLTLGFEMRERFYAGAEAGWGAQILEHPVSRVVIFADVDMSPQELDIDFASEDLPPRRRLGTIGLWCALHGSSIAQAGMHHLEAEFDYAQAQANLEAAGFGVMSPFTDLPMLKQAFTQPELWPVAPDRLQTLLDMGSITPEQADKFRAQGAAGSHLEILQRWEGFKGFNKTGVSDIILKTDARNAN